MTDNDWKKYHRSLPDISQEGLHENNSLTKMLRLIDENKQVLELGCATGYFSQFLTKKGCTVTGIEINPDSAKVAEQYCQQVIIADLDLVPLSQLLSNQKFDIAVLGDVLEHLRNPWRLLEEIHHFLKPDGYVVASILNIAHGAVRLALLQGKFEYTEVGLLDNTHLRFFTIKTVKELFERSGYHLDCIERTKVPIFSNSLVIPHVDRSQFDDKIIQFIAQDKESDTLQFILRASSKSLIKCNQGSDLPLVSICIPTYNGEKFIAKALSSALSQTYPNIEIIVSDDNSKDTTTQIVESFRENTTINFLLSKHSNYGLAANWNFCISQSKGKYIKFLFQDDLLEPDCIEKMVELAEQDDEIGLVFSPRLSFIEEFNSDISSQSRYHESKDTYKFWQNLKSIQSGKDLLTAPNLLDTPINKIGEPSTVLIKRDVFDRVGLFDTSLRQLVDIEMWLRIMSQCKIGFFEQPLSHFRIHPQQETQRNASAKEAMFLDYQKFYQKIYRDELYDSSLRQQAFCRYAVLTENESDLRIVRKQIAEQWINLSVEQLEVMYSSTLGKTHQIILNTGTKQKPQVEDEQSFVAELFVHISKGCNEPKIINYLLAVMLYCQGYHLPLQYDLSCIPQWLIHDYLKFLLEPPDSFQEIQVGNNYYQYMQQLVDKLHASILKNADSPVWRNIATEFSQLANFIPLYFNEINLKDIYIKRAEIIEGVLKANDYKVDYEFGNKLVNRKKIRLGILASHFLPTAETFASLPVYEYISRDFEVILYCLNWTGHSLEQYCQSCANSIRQLPLDLADQVNTIRADDLDVLYIATNVTAVTNQISLLSLHRLARVQTTSVASVVTTGMQHVDYYISSRLTDPLPTAQQHYREKLVKLEGTAQCFSYGFEQAKATIKVERESLGISTEAVVFISAANFFKITPELVDTWAKIISAVPSSVLVLLPFGPNWSQNYPKKGFSERLIARFSRHGVTGDHLIILDPQPVPNREDVKEYFKIADVYLDSYPFSGTTSLIEPLQVSLPVIARQGSCFRSAMGAAMLQALNLPDLVAEREETYIQLAIALGTNPELRQQKSNHIKHEMQGNPSFLDSRSYSAKIGELFQELLRNYLVDTLSRNLQLRDINLIIFPDWSQPEDLLYQDLASAIRAVANLPNNHHVTLLVDTSNSSDEDADMILSSVVINLLIEEDLDATEGAEISLVGKLDKRQWELIQSRIQARIALENENEQAIVAAGLINTPIFKEYQSISFDSDRMNKGDF